jgi:hypothetical protein
LIRRHLFNQRGQDKLFSNEIQNVEFPIDSARRHLVYVVHLLEASSLRRPAEPAQVLNLVARVNLSNFTFVT